MKQADKKAEQGFNTQPPEGGWRRIKEVARFP